jgi:hypothetical protein
VVDFRPLFGWIFDSAFGRFSTPLLGSFLTSILGGSVLGCSLTLNALPVYVSGRSGLVFEDS